MTSPSSYFQIHSPSIPTPTESNSSFHTLRTPTDHQIVPLARCEPVEEMEEKEIMSTNAQIVIFTLEQRFFPSLRGAEQSGVAKLLML
jgi:predicted ribosome-associated RNA-binding protein Tma20